MPAGGAYLRDMTERTDIVVAGGGLNGTALALALASGGFSVTMVDPVKAEIRADAGFDGRGYALSPSSVQVLKALGLWAGLQGNAQPILDIRITDGRPGEGPSPLMLEFDHREIEEGPMGFMIEDRFVRQALLAAVAKSDLIDHRGAVELLRKLRRIARRAVIVNDLRRHRVPWAFIATVAHVTRRDPMFRHDAPLSVLRGFTVDELRAAGRDAGVTDPRVVRRWPYRLVMTLPAETAA